MMPVRPTKKLNRGNHRAFTLLEVSLTLALAGTAMLYALYQKEEAHEEEIATIEAAQLLEIQVALGKYLEMYGSQLINNEQIVMKDSAGDVVLTIETGASQGQTLLPTVENLQALSLLSSTAATKTAVDGKDYLFGEIRERRKNEDQTITYESLVQNVTCQLHACQLVAYVHTNDALGVTAENPELNRKRIARVMNKLGDKGIETRGVTDKLLTSADEAIASVTGISAVRGIVGAYAKTTSLADIKTQWPGKDYCPAGIWEFDNGTVSNALGANADMRVTSNCYAPYGDIPVGLKIWAHDTDISQTPIDKLTGKVLLECVRIPGSVSAEVIQSATVVSSYLANRSCVTSN